MSILITHGYLLTGTGSNLYVNNLVRGLVQKGHDIILVCQDFDPIQIDFINEVYTFDVLNTRYFLQGKKDSPYKGNCKCFKPNLGGFLPVYVYDHYNGFTVKEFTSCTTEETLRYVGQNLNALQSILKDFKVTVINTNHMVMFPYVAALLKKEHSFKFVITVHGSALNFTVKKDKRFEVYAIESLKVVDEIVVDSMHAFDELKEFLYSVKLGYLEGKINIIPAGVDVNSFRIATKSREEIISGFISTIVASARESIGRDSKTTQNILTASLSENGVTALVEKTRKAYDYNCIDQDAVEKIKAVDVKGNNIIFVGKYLWTKGIYLILLAAPQILKAKPATHFIFAGFGPFREAAEIILNCLASGNIGLLKKMVNTNSLFHGDGGSVIPLIREILDKYGKEIEQDIKSLDFDIREKITFTGIINHDQLVNLMPAMDVLIAPSVFPEAFGMVAIEAASCGVYPVVTYQSAYREIADKVQEQIGHKEKINYITLDENASAHIAHNVLAYLEEMDKMHPDQLRELKESLRKLVVDHYSWEGIAGEYLKIYTGSINTIDSQNIV